MTGTTEDPHMPVPPHRTRRTGLAVLLCSVLVLVLGAGGWFGRQALVDGSGPAAAVSAGRAAAPSATSPVRALPSAPAASGPASGSVSVAPDRPLAGRTVLLDPGHNPGDVEHTAEVNRQVDVGNGHKACDATGTATDAGYPEAEYTLDVVRRARAVLEQRGARVVLTHDGDRPFGPCVDERARIGNEAKADAAVSVHADGAPAERHGFHVILPGPVTAGAADTSGIVEPSRRLGLLLRDRFQRVTGQPYADYLGKQGLDTRTDLGGLNLSRVPKVFIECGNMRNAGDAQHMTDPQWRQQAAVGIADGLTAYLTGAS